MDEAILSKYSTTKKKGVPRSERAEIADKTAQLLNQDIKKVLGWTRHLQPDQMYRLFQEASGSPRLWWWNYRQKYAKNNMTKIMVEKLTKFPEFRERKNRDVFIAKWALRDVEIDERTEDGQWKKISLLDKQKAGKMLTLTEFGKFGLRFSSLDRDWRDTLSKEDNKHLRGKDYGEKDILEEKKLNELGYR